MPYCTPDEVAMKIKFESEEVKEALLDKYINFYPIVRQIAFESLCKIRTVARDENNVPIEFETSFEGKKQIFDNLSDAYEHLENLFENYLQMELNKRTVSWQNFYL